MTFRKFLSYVPLLILALALARTVFVMNTTYNVVDDEDKLYLGITAVFVCSIFQIFRPRLGRWMTLATLLAGMAHLLIFTIVHGTTVLAFNSLSIKFDYFPFWVLVVFIIVNFQSVKRHMKWLFQEESPKEAQEESDGQV